MGNIGIGELIIIFLIILVIFGAKRLPEIGQALGKAVYEFKKSMSGSQEGDKQSKKESESGKKG
ncbi:MAG TPA: twin-arginine translocase TatA/TatE family subunit [Candidatus Omnitrophota bacterium]|nr:twin-arginine translocase TatA/TatE family subunit [Candidatus Omnitrophota bacterium]HPD84368.1 twin-arginine translocase TatA/TatE family subunit [Candidatus Omnitrophota bacterium]HRZ03226.1 twin-arginine translocase TatA/TatE family subunit [Candidatus Omnitrophota bacterium]